MIIHCDLQGRVSTVPSTVPMGTLLDDVVIMVPQANVTATLKVKPAYGEYLPDIICAPALTAENVLVFNAKLTHSVTRTAGRAEYQVLLTDPNGRAVASYMGSFNVSRGVMVDMPEDAADLHEYSLEQIYTMLSNVTTVYNQLANVENLIGIPKELATTEKTLIEAINVLHAVAEDLKPRMSQAEARIGSLETAHALTRNKVDTHTAQDISGAVLADENDPHHAQKALRQGISKHNSNSLAHPALRENIDRNATDIDALKGIVGDGGVYVGNDLTDAVNEAYDYADRTHSLAQTNRLRIINVDAQMQGISRTYVINTFLRFIEFIKGRLGLLLFEDRNGDGTDEQYTIYVDDLKTGDNVLVVEENVPDFWFEWTKETIDADTYPYDGVEYSLVAIGRNGSPVGLMHVLETDYTVIEGHAISAGASAAQAKQSEEAAKTYKNETERLAKSIYLKQVGPPISLLQKAIVLPSATLAQIGG